MNDQLVCPNCGHVVSRSDIICPNCGYDLRAYFDDLLPNHETSQASETLPEEDTED